MNSDVENLKAVTTILAERGVFFWLDQGTLLGAVREDALIPWDSDIDLSCWREDFPRLAALETDFREAGFYFEVHEYKDCAFLARGNGRTIEIAGQRQSNGYVYRQNAKPRNRRWERGAKRMLALLPMSLFRRVRHFARGVFRRPPVVFRTPASFFANFKTIDFLGCPSLHVPGDVEAYLEFKYGEDWKSPRRDWDYSKDDGAVSRT